MVTSGAKGGAKCGRGQLMRKGYTYTRADGTKVRVKPVCIMDMGVRGRAATAKAKYVKGKLAEQSLARKMTKKSNKCKKGQILRSAYIRKSYTSPRTKRRIPSTVVAASCVKDMGAPGKSKAKAFQIPIIRKGLLAKYGYHDIATLTMDQRHQALKKAVNAYGPQEVIWRLNAVANLQNVANPKISKMFRTDQRWVSALYKK